LRNINITRMGDVCFGGGSTDSGRMPGECTTTRADVGMNNCRYGVGTGSARAVAMEDV
jgi:hypothetical protein